MKVRVEWLDCCEKEFEASKMILHASKDYIAFRCDDNKLVFYDIKTWDIVVDKNYILVREVEEE